MEQGTGNKGQGFRQLLAWQKADDLAAEVFRLSEVVKPRHKWLGDQMARAAYSVTANIAEGYGRSSLPDYSRFLEIASASLDEVENALHFVSRNAILPETDLQNAERLRHAAGALLFGLKRALRAKLSNKGAWQRGLGESAAIYETSTDPGSEPMFHVPGSQPQSPKEVPHG